MTRNDHEKVRLQFWRNMSSDNVEQICESFDAIYTIVIQVKRSRKVGTRTAALYWNAKNAICKKC